MHSRSRRLAISIFLAIAVISALVALAKPSGTCAKQELAPTQENDDTTFLDGFRHVEVASVSAALEQIAGKKMYMAHRLRPMFPTQFAGFATRVALKKEANHDPDALRGMLHAIDTAAPNSVYVMVVEDGSDIAGIGGLTGTAMSARNLAGAVIDGGVRGTADLQKIAFPVYALGIVPSPPLPLPTTDLPEQIFLSCVMVFRWPRAMLLSRIPTEWWSYLNRLPHKPANWRRNWIKEHSMYAYIEKLNSIEQAATKFGRL